MKNKQPTAQFRMRVYKDQTIAVGPGKIALLEAIAQTGSISAAARLLKMSYRRAWLLVNETNSTLKSPAVTSSEGGAQGGGSRLTEVGQQLIAHYRAIEQIALLAAADEINALTALIAPQTSKPKAPPQE